MTLTKQKLENFILQELTQKQIADKLSLSTTTINYYCKKYGLKTRGRKLTYDSTGKVCTKCHTKKPLVDFLILKTGHPKSQCRDCTAQENTNRNHELKKLCVAYLGGKCTVCGYSKNLAALEFHHLDLTQKEFEISNFRKICFTKKLKKELDKCSLLCSNCHREVHNEKMTND